MGKVYFNVNTDPEQDVAGQHNYNTMSDITSLRTDGVLHGPSSAISERDVITPRQRGPVSKLLVSTG